MIFKHLIYPLQFIRNMGFGYIAFRSWYELQRRTGLLRLRFPVDSPAKTFISLDQWRSDDIRFFLDNPHANINCEIDRDSLYHRFNRFKESQFLYFNSTWYTVTDWHTNPETGYRYNAAKHWTDIPNFSSKSGDIKYVWEKSRFTFLYDLIRYDIHFLADQSEIVLREIENWIAANPENCGPNWMCSQEISIRILNWTFALQYYKASSNLTEERFILIINSIYRQMQHVAENIDFSRISVRNNHALTETLTLWLTGLLYPFFSESSQWKKDGKKWFETEIAYQIEQDGTFLQFSMNYHRIVIQLLTLAIRLADLNGEKWAPVIYERATKSLEFLRSCQDDATGWLPNYGNNDGALFFQLTDCHFRDFRPQLLALASVLGKQLNYDKGKWEEEASWFGVGKMANNQAAKSKLLTQDSKFICYEKSGYFIIRDHTTITFLRCGSYRQRPFQADNLHLDIWVNGENILRDAGSYKYNTSKKWRNYFSGTASHNTVMLGDFDQMRRGARFIWYDWITKTGSSFRKENDSLILQAEFEGFREAGRGIVHRRKVTKVSEPLHWTVEDWVENAPANLPMHQIWHPGESFFHQFSIQAFDKSGKEIFSSKTEGWYSESYGHKISVPRLVFSSLTGYVKTIIKRNLS